MLTPPRAMIRACRRGRGAWKLCDSTGATATGRQTLMRTLVLSRLLRRCVLAHDERYVGVLLPPSVGAGVVNAALAFAGRVSANLNYSATSAVINKCVRRAGIRHVLTTRKVMEKLGVQLDCEPVYLEDLRPRLTLADKAWGALAAYATPAWLLERLLGVHRTRPDDEVTVLFTSGSTGDPKGVVLSHGNVMSNVYGMDAVVHLRPDDVVLGILPFFHAFGYTVTLWGPLMLDIRAAFHFSPLDARQVGAVVRERGATIMVSTPTFLRGYIKRCDREDFASLDLVVAGAEKLPEPLRDAFEEKFGVRPVEGYGATELGPLVSVNIPPGRARAAAPTLREGSVGRPLPGVRVRIVHPETRAPLPDNEDGMLEVAGGNLMLGYLHDPQKTAEVVREGWYSTGDIAHVDPEGFIFITGRQSRFSKIGGEMVPHGAVEEAIQAFVAAGADDVLAIVTAVPCPKKGERLVVVHRELPKTPAEISSHLAATGVPNLWIPGNDSYLRVDELPLLGSGKLDLKALAALARDRFGADEPSAR